MSTTNKSSESAIDSKLIAGLQSPEASLPGTLFLDGQTYTAPQAVAVLQNRVNAINAVTTAKAAWQGAVKANLATKAATKVVVADLRQQLLLWFSKTPSVLANFGLTPKKTASKTVVTKAVAVAKLRATRLARGTKGSDQKRVIKGAVSAMISIPTAPQPKGSPAAIVNGGSNGNGNQVSATSASPESPSNGSAAVHAPAASQPK
jgi:hypothetical protein